MKRIGILLGGVVAIAIFVLGLFIAAKVAFPIYIAMHRDDIETHLAQQDKKQQEEESARIMAQAKAASQPLPAAPVITPPDKGQPNEDDWIAANTAREIVSMAEAIRNPNAAVPKLNVSAHVDAGNSSVHVEIDGTSRGQLVADLKPVFAWDADGYAPLAQKALVGFAADNANDGQDVLADLGELTGYNLAKADVRLSSELQDHPSAWRLHEDAAFVLCALALRENAGGWTDTRKMLSRATAHLAIAQSLRGSDLATWPGLIADAAIRTLSGRELDATSHLDSLASRKDVPTSASPWLASLKTLAKLDWRVANVTATSPLVLKIAWFQAVADDMPDGPAVSRLDQIVPPPKEGADGTMDQNAGKGDWQLPDWGRAALAGPGYITVQNGWRYTEAQITLELNELGQIFEVEGAPPVDEQNIASALGERENPSVETGPGDKPLWHAIGLGTFKDASRRHLFVTIHAAYDFYNMELGSHESAEALRVRLITMFKGVPLASQAVSGIGDGITSGQASAQDRATEPADIPATEAFSMPEYANAKQFYGGGVPFGTTYQARFRLEGLGVDPSFDEKIKNVLAQADAQREKELQGLSIGQQMDKFHKIAEETKKTMDELIANRGPTPREKALLLLAPGNYDLATDHLCGKALLAAATPFLDYNSRAFGRLEEDPPQGLAEADQEPILRRDAVFDPQKYFALGVLLRDEGRIDEAAQVDRIGVAKSVDDVGFSDAVDPLVEYDLDHGDKAEAEQIAERANATGSAAGMCVEMLVLEKDGELDKAAELGEQLKQGYGYASPVYGIYARHHDHFPNQYAGIVAQFFPDGMDHATFDTFYQAPAEGVCLTGKTKPVKTSGLKLGDVIVACNGYKVSNVYQYDVIRDLNGDPVLDLVVWRGDKYEELKPSLPSHRFNAELSNYTPGPHL
jgi:hypothetical protein